MSTVTIDYVINAKPCPAHDAALGEACWAVPRDFDRGDPFLAICNSRALAAGCDGRPPVNIRHWQRPACKERMQPVAAPPGWQERLRREVNERLNR